MPLTKDRQYRALPFTTPTKAEKKNKFDSDCYVEGYAAKYERYLLFPVDGGKDIYEEFIEFKCHNTRCTNH